MAGEAVAERDSAFLKIWESLDHAAINAEILRTEGPSYTFDLEEANKAVYVAAHRWLLEDLTDLAVSETERVYVQNGFKFVLDLQGTFTGDGYKTFQHGSHKYGEATLGRFKGLRFVADWKTTKSELDVRWQQRLVDSWQWRAYLAETGADVFVYRGIRRKTRIGDEIETREFYIDRSTQPDLKEVHDINVKTTTAVRDGLIQLGVTPWPQNRPSACGAFGRECPYKADCDTGLKYIPTGALVPGRPFSYSRMETFKLCSERYRRDVLAQQSALEDEGTGPEAEFGKAVHRALASIYSQSYGLAKPTP